MGSDSLNNQEMLESTDNFEAAYRAHSEAIYKFMFWRTRDTQLSEDLTSTTFVKAWAARRSFKNGHVLAWFYTIARNVLTDYWRKRKELTLETEIEPEQADSNAERLDKQIDKKRLTMALDILNKDMHNVVTLRFLDGLSCRQVAKRLDISEANVRVLQYRALKRLKDQLDES
jgi:RNA polymerase sigma-70 factor (ECF subfamily)